MLIRTFSLRIRYLRYLLIASTMFTETLCFSQLASCFVLYLYHIIMSGHFLDELLAVLHENLEDLAIEEMEAYEKLANRKWTFKAFKSVSLPCFDSILDVVRKAPSSSLNRESVKDVMFKQSRKKTIVAKILVLNWCLANDAVAEVYAFFLVARDYADFTLVDLFLNDQLVTCANLIMERDIAYERVLLTYLADMPVAAYNKRLAKARQDMASGAYVATHTPSVNDPFTILGMFTGGMGTLSYAALKRNGEPPRNPKHEQLLNEFEAKASQADLTERLGWWCRYVRPDISKEDFK